MVSEATVAAADSAQPAQPLDLVQLVQQCRAGDTRAWEALVTRYAGLINGVAVRYGLGEYDRADVFQNVCVELWRNLDKIHDPARLPGWLVTVTGRACWQQLRQKYSKQTASALTDEELATLADQGRSPEEDALLSEQWAALGKAVEGLDGRCRALVWGLFFDPSHPSYEEMGRRLKMPKDSVGPVRLRCLARLRQLLTASYGEPY